MRKTGYLRNWNSDKGFGFVSVGFRTDAFVHISALPKEMVVTDQTYIEFLTKETKKGVSAYDITDVTAAELEKIAADQEKDRLRQLVFDTFEQILIDKYTPLLAMLKPASDKPNDLVVYEEQVDEMKLKAEFDIAVEHEYSSLHEWEKLNGLFPTQITSEIRECNQCKNWFDKKEINFNYSHFRLYKCDCCVVDWRKQDAADIIDRQAQMDPIDLSTITTKQGLKDIVKVILAHYAGRTVGEMDDTSKKIIFVVLSNGTYNVGYFNPGSGREKGSSYPGWQSTGTRLVNGISWRSKKGNFCNGSEVFRTMGSIDDNYKQMLEIIQEFNN